MSYCLSRGARFSSSWFKVKKRLREECLTVVKGNFPDCLSNEELGWLLSVLARFDYVRRAPQEPSGRMGPL